jgi:hypothetical protein
MLEVMGMSNLNKVAMDYGGLLFEPIFYMGLTIAVIEAC